MNRVEADLCIPAAHPSLAGHFPGNPIVPGVLLLGQVLSLLSAHTGRRVGHLRQVRFTSALRPDEPAHLRCELHGSDADFSILVRRAGVEVSVARGSVSIEPARGAAR